MGIFDSIKNAFSKGAAAAGVQGIESVQDNPEVAAPPPAPQQTAQPSATGPAAAAEGAGGARSYTVVSGDTLWRIAERMYGNGSHYMKIFEANTGVLEHPDQIFPGQKLVIPKL
jgi:nucleoid-associated protein YgaU